MCRLRRKALRSGAARATRPQARFGPQQVLPVRHPEGPILRRRHRVGRTGFGAKLADDAASVVDGEAAVARLDRMRRADGGAFRASLAAGGGIVSGHAEHALLPGVFASPGPGRRRLSARKSEECPQGHEPLLPVAAGDGQTETGFVDRIVHHVGVVHGEGKRAPVRERRRLDLDAREPAVRADMNSIVNRAARPFRPSESFSIRRRRCIRRERAPAREAEECAGTEQTTLRLPRCGLAPGRKRRRRRTWAPSAAGRRSGRRDGRGAGRGRCPDALATGPVAPWSNATFCGSRPVVIRRSR